jgi:hypothetical protein
MDAGFINKLSSLRSLVDVKSSDIRVNHLQQVASMFGFDVPISQLQDVTDLIRKGNEDDIAMWAAEPANLEVLRSLRSPSQETELIQCTSCNNMSIFDVNEIASVNPHVLCRHCEGVIKLNFDN